MLPVCNSLNNEFSAIFCDFATDCRRLVLAGSTCDGLGETWWKFAVKNYHLSAHDQTQVNETVLFAKFYCRCNVYFSGKLPQISEVTEETSNALFYVESNASV